MISRTITLDKDVISRLEILGRAPGKQRRNLSAGIALVERLTRDLGSMSALDLYRLRRGHLDALRKEAVRAGWIVFELIDGPADAPARGSTLCLDFDSPILRETV